MIFKHKTFSQKQLGELFGVSSHEIGKWLVKVGLRDEKSGKPTRDAHEGGYCETAPSGQTGYFWAWKPEKTVQRFIDAGYRLLSELPEEWVEPSPLNGPFRISESCPKEILNSDGSLAVRAACRRNAEVVLKLLVLAEKHGAISKMNGKVMQPNEG